MEKKNGANESRNTDDYSGSHFDWIYFTYSEVKVGILKISTFSFNQIRLFYAEISNKILRLL